MKPNPTIKDVAREACVSISTVSRVLNNKSTVAPELAEKVNRAVEQLGYHPNSIARTLKSDSSKTVGFVVSDISNDFFTRMARGVEDVLNERGYSLFVCSTDSTQRREEQSLSILREKQVDGLIINTSGKNDELIAGISHRLPIALFGRKISTPDFVGDFVDNDNFSGVRELTKHLIGLGHRKIGLLNGQNYVSSAKERLSGFQSAMREIGVVIDEDYPYLYNGSFNRLASGTEGTKYLYERGATAVISANNLLALGALQFCHDARICVPRELSLCSFGTIANHSLLYVRPTCVEQAPASMGARLAELIIERIEAKNQLANRELRFAANLIMGNGTDVPRRDTAASEAPNPDR